ncbi:hypothetical protein ACTI_66730 [Actinoplanes sp. OR16]|uniref:hypothetical protein n=1 Tax=Actinoplanes sp. OR16 TaxID=946334 RepID=UPI000F6B5032|nr:hypothetical protein [Actinoplanes sp. OR16]BBH69988.1 hypothetical protein ACTI_66730 [Actinoplanes sp. OR16]
MDRDLRWVDLHLRLGDIDAAIRTIGAARERALHAANPQIRYLVDVREAAVRVRMGDLDGAATLLDDAGRAWHNDHGRALAGSVRAGLCVARGDLAGADEALREAYAAALDTRDRPMLAVVAVQSAWLAAAQQDHHAAAVLLGAASRLRGTRDRTDPQVRELTGRGHAALGAEGFASAYAKGWELTIQAAVRETDPALPRHGPSVAGPRGIRPDS